LDGIYDFEETESMKVCISCANPPDSMLAHKDSCMRVVEQIACKLWNLLDNLFSDCGMSLRGNENAETGEVRSAVTNFHPSSAFHGRRSTRG
jgi:hypothetical protein